MDTNPFQSPEVPDGSDPQQPGFDPRKVGLARQVPVVAVLMAVHGAVLSLVGAGFLVFTVFFSGKFIDQIELQQKAAPNPQQLNPQAMQWLIQGIYGGFGIVILIAGVLGIFAGIRNYSFRGRVLGIISLVCGMITVLTCWCAPFSLGLLIYGLIVYLGKDADLAFRWQEAKSQRGAA